MSEWTHVLIHPPGWHQGVRERGGPRQAYVPINARLVRRYVHPETGPRAVIEHEDGRRVDIQFRQWEYAYAPTWLHTMKQSIGYTT